MSATLAEKLAEATHNAARKRTGYQPWAALLALAERGDRESQGVVRTGREEARAVLAVIEPAVRDDEWGKFGAAILRRAKL